MRPKPNTPKVEPFSPLPHIHNKIHSVHSPFLAATVDSLMRRHVFSMRPTVNSAVASFKTKHTN